MQNRVKIRHFEAAIALAEELNYSRAAARLDLSQSGMTRCIQSIERETKTVLFYRTTKGVQVTDAGRAYVEQGRLALAYGERALQLARNQAVASQSVLRVGKSPDTDPILIEILYAVRLPLYPALQITLDSGSSAQLAHDLVSSQLDLALITRPEKNAKLTMVKLLETPLFVLLRHDHPAAKLASLNLHDLNGERVILIDRRAHPLLYARIVEHMREEGCIPRGLDHISYPDEALTFIEAGGGVAILPKAQARRLANERYVLKPLREDDLCLDEHIASRADDESKLLSEFNRAYNVKAKTVLQPLQMDLGIDGGGPAVSSCAPR